MVYLLLTTSYKENMIFSSAIFLFSFLPVSIVVNLVIKEKYRNIWLILCSVFFYAWSQPQFLWIIFAIILINYTAAILIEKEIKPKVVLLFSLVGNLSGLVYFKYFNFIIDTINNITQNNIHLLNLILPIGISFYTFKGISYVSDVYMKRIHAERNIVNFSAYIIMFPEIMSGPIDTYENIYSSLYSRQISAADFNDGIRRFVFGLAQKMLLANTLGIMVDDIWRKGAGAISWKTAWLGSIAYTLQIYFDFAGYSSMAIGIGKMLGLRFSENFDFPYMSKSITEFWRRWHITLGEWFKKYVYIPLGGNRKSVIRGYINLGIVFLLTGIWHGASWTFILWGILHGLFRIIEKLFSHRRSWINLPDHVANFLKHLYCLFVVNLGWVLFRAPDIKSAFYYVQAMFGKLNSAPCGISVREYLNKWNVFILIAAIVFSTTLPRQIIQNIKLRVNASVYIIVRDITLILMLLSAASEVVTNTYKTFIYFQF